MSNLPDDFTFSQSSLQDYVTCPRRFELRYLQRVVYPAPQTDNQLEFERRMQAGSDLHHLIHQHLVGISADLLRQRARGVNNDDTKAELSAWFDNYLAQGLDDVPEAIRKPEFTLQAPLGTQRLLAKYDLLAIDPGKRALIIDWKSSERTPEHSALAARMQTRVYCYVLAKAGDTLNAGQPIKPDQIAMRYWYAQTGEAVTINYSAHQMREDAAYFTELLQELDARRSFPLTQNTRHCTYCPYRTLCERGTVAGALDELEFDADADAQASASLELDIEQIAEIEF
jgi:CRISPR/Cas system-associated exonuclease Cas4 (RecB family)